MHSGLFSRAFAKGGDYTCLWQGQQLKKVGFYLGQTSPYTEACQDITGSCLTDEDYSLLSLESVMKMAGAQRRGILLSSNASIVSSSRSAWGGCPYLFLKKGKVHCRPWKHHLAESLALYYYLQKTRRETEIIGTFNKAVESAKELQAALKPQA